VIVVWLFSGHACDGISALAIPLSAIPTFAFMQMLGFSLNSISLLALSLVAGVLVDDAIVEIENIVRHIHGKTASASGCGRSDRACGCRDSCTIIAVFLPVSFMPGISGQYFIAVWPDGPRRRCSSPLLVARLITPVIAAYYISSRGMLPCHGDGRSCPCTSTLNCAYTIVGRRWAPPCSSCCPSRD